MRKQDFLVRLRKGLSGLPLPEREERVTFYSEMIDDRMEEGLSEEEAVLAVGSVDDIVAQILGECPRAGGERAKRRLKAWEIILLALGSPVWLSLGIAAVAVILSLYVVLWSVVLALWSVFGALVGCAFGGVAAGGAFLFGGNGPVGAAVLGAGMVCAGVAVFLFFGCRASTVGVLRLTGKFAAGIGARFARKEETVCVNGRESG